MRWYPWLNSSYHTIITQHIAHRGHHALLIQALPGMGVEILIREVARWLMCYDRQGVKSCGQCHSCGLMLSGTHPDMHKIEIQKNTNTIGIDIARGVIAKLYQHSHLGGAKIVLLLDAYKLTESAAHALLKTLEEPSSNTWFFLTVHDPSYLLMTLRSRCLLLKLPIPDEAFSLHWIKQQHSSEHNGCHTALRLSSGAPLEALELLTGSSWKQRLLVCSRLSEALHGDLLSLLPVLNDNNAIKRINWLCSLLIDAEKYRKGAGEFVSNLDNLPLIIKIVRLLSSPMLHESLDTWTRCYKRLLTIEGVNSELLLTEQLLRWERALKK
ncbi:DNA polymerase III subunit delta' C-terminal domain-containing protein [Candidatus Erwinia haradaeae]|uniref:DNA polymerase III subunit delta' n=1 Tax=Candidatus Erwinia haradaeae TaxID=1922217 RepID=A0A451DAG0_9GAMM|nr:DNA polymerase III subunit delta' C-terminal domain-containing protein [Candidatus Erwinia haradaeae]VFP83333.1 DNA polymerase III subunit delta' [Candidatus Erwinia haradaeae]